MLEKIEITGFKGISGLTIDNFKKVNLFIGPNNCGKTSLLEALFINAAPTNFNSLIHTFARPIGGLLPIDSFAFLGQAKLLFSNIANSPSKFQIKSSLNGIHREIKCQIHSRDHAVLEELAPQSDLMTSASTSNGTTSIKNKKAELSDIHIGSLKFSFQKGNKKYENEMKFLADGKIEIPQQKLHTDIAAAIYFPYMRSKNDVINNYSLAVEKGYHKEVIELIHNLFPEIEDILLIKTSGLPEPQLCVVHKELGTVLMGTQGSGVGTIITLGFALYQCINGALLIDEIESSLDPKALYITFKWLVEICNKNNTQIFATTHSLEAIDVLLSVLKNKKEDCAAFKLNRTDKTPTVKRYSGNLLYDVRYEMGLEVRE